MTRPARFRPALLLAAAVFAAGCMLPGTSGVEKIRVGVFVSLTGGTGGYGISATNGIRMATEEVNAGGGINGQRVNLVLQDTRSDPRETVRVVERLVAEHHVHALLGEVVSSRSLVAAEVAQAARVPMLTPSSTSVEVTQKGDFVFRGCYTDPFQAAALAHFAAVSLHATRAALMYDGGQAYSANLAQLIRESFAAQGGQVVVVEQYREGDEDFTGQLSAVKAASPQVIFVPGYYREAGIIARQAREMGIPAALVGGDGWDSLALYHIGGRALVGSFFSNHYSASDPDPVAQRFVAAYRVMYGSVPDAFAATAYDAARLLFDAFARARSTDPRAVRDALAATSDFHGVTGTITFDAQRNAVKPVVIIRIEEGGLYGVQERVSPRQTAPAPPRAANALPGAAPDARVR